MARQSFQISVLLLSTQMFFTVATQQCGGGESEQSILGWMLQRHIYKTMFAELSHTCVLSCRKDDRCQSFNWVISISMCEFNNRTKEARPENFVPNPDRFYFRKDKNRVPLGSIPELPAETCKEIKASNRGQAVNKKYWLSSIKPGLPVLAYCDMKTEDVDECTAFPSICHDNANCKNTRGSYRCTCKTGFSGDGKTCRDVDECTASPSVCDVNANCKNSRGSYDCTCKPGFSGDGKTCQVHCVSPSVCHVNANCRNTRGSYGCTCKAGFSGDGKTCRDIDECTTNTHLCDVNAACNNTIGSHNCTCKYGSSGDGKTCPGPWSVTTNGRKGRFGRIQTFTVPRTTRYLIKSWGARGGTHSCNYGAYPGTYNGGRGAYKEGTISLNKGTVLNIVVGQRGGDSVEVQDGRSTNLTAAQLGQSVEDNAGTGGGGGSFVYKSSNVLLIAAGGGGGASSGYNGVDGQAGTSGASSVGSNPSQIRSGGTGGQPGQCNNASASYHGGVGAGWLAQGCSRAGSEHGERGGSRAQGWVGGRAGGMNSGYNGGPPPGAVGGFGGGGGGSEDNGASGGGGGYSGGGSGTHDQQAGGGGGSFCGGSSCSGVTGGNSKDNGLVQITEL